VLVVSSPGLRHSLVCLGLQALQLGSPFPELGLNLRIQRLALAHRDLL
jgi:hypothetical protein